MSALRKVRLYGELGKKFGRVHHFAVKTPAEAVRALCVNYPEFEKHLAEAHTRNVGYRVLHGRDVVVGEPEKLLDPASGTIKIVPVAMGAKEGGLGQVLLGILIVAVAWWAAPAGMGLSGLLSGEAGMASVAASIGLSLAIGGVMQMLSPQPKANQGDKREERQPSYIMDGTTNTMAQGHPVPLGYGRMVVGSAVISAGMSVDELPVTDEEEAATPAAPSPDWTNPTTSVIEKMPAPTIVWNNAAEQWELPTGEAFKKGTDGQWRLRDMMPVFNTPYDRWDAQNGTAVVAAWDAETSKWRMTTAGNGWKGAELTYDTVEKRWEVQRWEYTYAAVDQYGQYL